MHNNAEIVDLTVKRTCIIILKSNSVYGGKDVHNNVFDEYPTRQEMSCKDEAKCGGD